MLPLLRRRSTRPRRNLQAMVIAAIVLLGGLVLSSCSSTGPLGMLERTANTSADEVAACRIGDAAVFLRIKPDGSEVLLQTHRRYDGTWSEPEPATTVAPALEARAGKPAIAYGTDGTLLLVFPAHRTPTNVDLAECTFDGQRWSSVQWLDQLNSEAWDSQPALSPDGMLLVFSSNRPGGRGGKDLYASYRTPQGWSAPVLLSLCTAGDEITPALLADSTLLFARQRDTTRGDFDISRALPTAPLQWGTVAALPQPINSTADEIAPVVWDDQLIVSSNRNGNLDLVLLPLCGAVVLDMQVLPSDVTELLSGVATVASARSLETIPIGADGRARVRLQPSERYIVRYTNSCTTTGDSWELVAPCDPQRAVVLELPIALSNDGARWETTIVNAFVPDDYMPATEEHRTARALLERYNLDGDAVAGAEAHLDRTIITALLEHCTEIVRCAPSAMIEINIEASRTTRALGWSGARVSIPADGPLELHPAMMLSPQEAGLVRAYAVQQLIAAAIDAHPLLARRADRIRWRLADMPDTANALRLRVQVLHR